jgi:hypothetical protein
VTSKRLQALIDKSTNPRDFDLSGLRKHMEEMHPRVTRKRSNADLAWQHARMHTRYHPNHGHEAGRITIKISGLPVQYDEGWLTGQCPLTPEQVMERFRAQADEIVSRRTKS